MEIDIYGIIVGIFSLLPHLILRVTGKFIYFALFSVLAIILHGTYLFGPQIFYLLLLTYVVSTVAELVSLKTPIRCFGVAYWYNLKHPFFSSRIYLLGVYPLEISVAWVILKYVSFTLAMLISSAFSLSQVATIFLIPLILVSLDFIIDPVAVNKTKLWQWGKGSRYFGIPLRNFLCWYVVGLVASALYIFIDQDRQVTFHFLYILPIIFYASIFTKVPLMVKLDKNMALIGSFPAAAWTLLSVVSLLVLFLR